MVNSLDSMPAGETDNSVRSSNVSINKRRGLRSLRADRSPETNVLQSRSQADPTFRVFGFRNRDMGIIPSSRISKARKPSFYSKKLIHPKHDPNGSRWPGYLPANALDCSPIARPGGTGAGSRISLLGRSQ